MGIHFHSIPLKNQSKKGKSLSTISPLTKWRKHHEYIIESAAAVFPLIDRIPCTNIPFSNKFVLREIDMSLILIVISFF